jgi:hypothetical protein
MRAFRPKGRLNHPVKANRPTREVSNGFQEVEERPRHRGDENSLGGAYTERALFGEIDIQL